MVLTPTGYVPIEVNANGNAGAPASAQSAPGVLKYNPNQPRVSAGNPDGGKWTSEGDSGSSNDATPPSDTNADGTSNPDVQFAQLDTGRRTDASGSGGDPISSRDIPVDDPKHPVPFVDSAGKPVTDNQGNALLRPADLPPEMYVREGLAIRDQFVGALTQDSGVLLSGATAALGDELLRFGQGGPWDAQRIQGQVVSDYRDYATIAIGLYMAAAGVPIQFALSLENGYAFLHSNFDPMEPKDEVYTYLPKRNVRNTEIGYELYESGRISARP